MARHVIHGKLDGLFVQITEGSEKAAVMGFQYAGARPIPLAVAVWQVLSRFKGSDGDFTVRWAVDGSPEGDDWYAGACSHRGHVQVAYERRFNLLTSELWVEEAINVGGVNLIDQIQGEEIDLNHSGHGDKRWLHLEIEDSGREVAPRPVPVTILGVVIGMAAEYGGITSGTEETYRDVLFDPIGVAALSLRNNFQRDGHDFAFDHAAGAWSIWDGDEAVAEGYVDLRGLYEKAFA